MLLSTTRRLMIADRKVSCPLRGDCDVERCLVCPYLNAVNLKDRMPSVSCRVPEPTTPLLTFGLYGKE